MFHKDHPPPLLDCRVPLSVPIGWLADDSSSIGTLSLVRSPLSPAPALFGAMSGQAVDMLNRDPCLPKGLQADVWLLVVDIMIDPTGPFLPQDRPEHLPIIYHRRGHHRKSNVLALAATCSWLYDVVMKRAWRHVVLSKPSHLLNLLDTPPNPSTARFYDRTLRCDIRLPINTVSADIHDFLALLPNLKALTLDSPRLTFFTLNHVVLPSTLTSLQIGTLPPDFTPTHLLQLSTSFPHLTHLQVLRASACVPAAQPFDVTLHDTLLPNVVELALGEAWEFMPHEPPMQNKLARMLSAFPPSTLMPQLTTLTFERNAFDAPEFLAARGGEIIKMFVDASHDDLMHFDFASTCPRLSSLVLMLDSRVCPLPLLPPKLDHVHILLPFTPTWRPISTLHFSLLALVEAIMDNPASRIPPLVCERRGGFIPWAPQQFQWLARVENLQLQEFTFREYHGFKFVVPA